jgi:hypothetical protein
MKIQLTDRSLYSAEKLKEYLFTKCMVLVDCRTGDKRFYDTTKNHILTGIDPDVCSKALKTKLDDPILAEFVFEPFKKLEGQKGGMLVANQHVPPEWYFAEQPAQPQFPNISAYLDHLFPSPESLTYVLDWLSNIVQGNRNLCYLTLLGGTRIGKGFFYETILKNLIGPDYCLSVTGDILESDFNSEMQNKIVIHLNEFAVDGKKMEAKLKALGDETLRVTAKGKDSVYVKNNLNIMLSSNRVDALGKDTENGRISFMDLATDRLETKFPDPKILAAQIKEEIKDFGWFLMTRQIERKSMNVRFEGEVTQEVTEINISEWEEYVLNLAEKATMTQEIFIADLKQQIHRNFGYKLGRRRFKNFAYQHPDLFKYTHKDNRNHKLIILKPTKTLIGGNYE